MKKYFLSLFVLVFINCGGGGGSSSNTTTTTTTNSSSSTISHNSFSYGIITSPITSKKWLDRNLGASEVCSISRGLSLTTFDSSGYSTESNANAAYVTSQGNCLGDLYQWGRLTDGHEKGNNTTTTQASVISNAGSNFIYNNNDWTSADSDGSLRSAQWSKTDGSSICPIGFRVPTRVELAAETTDNSIQDTDINNNGNIEVVERDTAFLNFLKLPAAGYHDANNSSAASNGGRIFLWTSTAGGGTSTDYVTFYNTGCVGCWLTGTRGTGQSVRCIEN